MAWVLVLVGGVGFVLAMGLAWRLTDRRRGAVWAIAGQFVSIVLVFVGLVSLGGEW